MNNFLTDDAKVIVLVCGILGDDRSVKPLSQTEYSTLVSWLISKNMRPKDLLQRENANAAATGIEAKVDPKRLLSLLERGVQLGFIIEEWQRNGIWIISRSDDDYPKCYKTHLKDKAPPLLFGIGNRDILHSGGVAIIGSRNIDAVGEKMTRQAAELCANNKMTVISGGARGVDQIAMKAALDVNGVAIGVLAENLLKKSLERNARKAIAEERLLLISPYHPKARFSVGTAMGRNKLIYALANYGLVINAEYKKGGTWAGAVEELKRDNAISVFVRFGENIPLGNKKLLELGAIKWPKQSSEGNLKQQLDRFIEGNAQNSDDLLDFQSKETKELKAEKTIQSSLVNAKNKKTSKKLSKGAIYEAVLPIIIEQLEVPVTSDELSVILNISKSQLASWLKQAVAENKIKKLLRPVRYHSIKAEQIQLID